MFFHKLVNTDIFPILGFYRYFLFRKDILHKAGFTSLKIQSKVVNK